MFDLKNCSGNNKAPEWVRSAVLIVLACGLSCPVMPAMAQSYMPPDRGLPGRREGGGTRGNCLANQTKVMAIAPQTNFGTTTQAQPTLLWYISASTAKVAEFELRNDQEEVIYVQPIQLTGEAGMLKLQLSQTQPLEVGQRYHWYFALVCDDQDRSGDVITEGWIERIPPNAELENQLNQAEAIDRATLYAQAGIWYDALATLMDLQTTQFDQAVLSERWRNLLSSVNLANLADKTYSTDVVLP